MAQHGKPFIPRPDGDFNAYAINYVLAGKDWWANQGLDLAEFKVISDALTLWQEAYEAHTAAQRAAESARAIKVAARATLEGLLRPNARFIQAYPATTDADRAGIGLAVRSTSRRHVPPPATRPVVTLAPAAAFTHELRIADETTPHRRAKPRSAAAAEVWSTLTPPHATTPTTPHDLRFMLRTSRPTARCTYTLADVGKNAVYWVRWVSAKGETGPWSEVVRGTVAA